MFGVAGYTPWFHSQSNALLRAQFFLYVFQRRHRANHESEPPVGFRTPLWCVCCWSSSTLVARCGRVQPGPNKLATPSFPNWRAFVSCEGTESRRETKGRQTPFVLLWLPKKTSILFSSFLIHLPRVGGVHATHLSYMSKCARVRQDAGTGARASQPVQVWSSLVVERVSSRCLLLSVVLFSMVVCEAVDAKGHRIGCMSAQRDSEQAMPAHAY